MEDLRDHARENAVAAARYELAMTEIARQEGITVTVYLNRGFCYAPVEAGQPLGQVVWRRGDHVIGTAVLAAGENIPALESHRPWWQKLYG